MFKIIMTVFLVAVSVATVSAQTRVRGYTKSNGTYVAPHYRSDRDSTVKNNYSYSGNRNPYTGSVGSNKYYSSPTSEYYKSYAPARLERPTPVSTQRLNLKPDPTPFSTSNFTQTRIPHAPPALPGVKQTSVYTPKVTPIVPRVIGKTPVALPAIVQATPARVSPVRMKKKFDPSKVSYYMRTD